MSSTQNTQGTQGTQEERRQQRRIGPDAASITAGIDGIDTDESLFA